MWASSESVQPVKDFSSKGVRDRTVPRVDNLHVSIPITTLAIDSLRVRMQPAEKDRHYVLVFLWFQIFPPQRHALTLHFRSRFTP